MRRTPLFKTLFRRCRLSATAARAVFLCLLLLTGLAGAASFKAGLAQDPAAFVTGLEDVPLAPELQDVPDAKQFLDNVKSNRFVAMSDADYDIVRELRAAKEKLKNQ